MSRKLVDVFDRSGGKLFTYSIALEDVDCLDGEFEEVALIFAESSGLVATEEIVHLRARCESAAIVSEVAAAEPASKRTARPKNTVLSMVKHRMKKAAAAGHAGRARHVS
jgi:hypothetical protein